MNRQRTIRIAVVAGVVLLIALGLGLAMRTAPPAVESETAPGGTSRSGGAAGKPAPLTSDRGPGGKAPAITGGHGGGVEQLPEGHPEVEPAPDEKSQVSIQWIGHSEFYIQSPAQVVVVTDPFDPAFTGYADSSARAHVVTVSHE